MYDLLIRAGTIVDGSGNAAFTGDVAIENGCIVAVGRVDGAARRTLDARGLLVTPGFVDVHTHYDGQATWDPLLTPSCWHGVTTAVMGNCGVGFAPMKSDRREFLIELMEGVEDIPGAVLAEGVDWGWESFPEYLDALAAKPCVMDLGAQLPHAALRYYVMGERGAAREAANGEDLQRMAELTEQALTAGALGFTTSRTLLHNMTQPSYLAVAQLPLAERVTRMRDPALRARILAEPLDALPGRIPAFIVEVLARLDRVFALGDPPDYEPPPEASVAARAARLGCDPLALMYELLLERDGRELLFAPAANYVDCDYEAALAMLRHPHTVVGLGDGGAHCGSICDGSYPTYLLTHWARDRTRGERLPLEFAVRRYTRAPAG